MRTGCHLLIIAALTAWSVAVAQAPRHEQTCPGGASRVVATDAGDAALACEGARRALAFLGGMGLNLPGRLTIEVVDELPPLYGAGQLGSFDARSGLVRVLSHAGCAGRVGREGLLFDQPLSDGLYLGLVAHEVAHAVFDSNYLGDSPRLVAQEYIAYTTQFVAMPVTLRERILAASAVRAFGSTDEMTAMRYFFDPQGFGIAAYRHFIDSPDGCGFVWRLLRGEAGLPPTPSY